MRCGSGAGSFGLITMMIWEKYSKPLSAFKTSIRKSYPIDGARALLKTPKIELGEPVLA